MYNQNNANDDVRSINIINIVINTNRFCNTLIINVNKDDEDDDT